MRQESGFTLIELIVVIVILGILAAFAVPRFVGMQDEARSSTLQGLTGSIRGASAMVHGKALVNQVVNGSVNAEGKTVGVTYSYPNATETDFENMIQDLSGFETTTTPPNNFGNSTATDSWIAFKPKAASNPSTCSVGYEEALSSSDQPNIHVNASDCS